ncbi:hypothetical protein NECAME_16889 [Necator americanus]|uniref:Uncharacterized protein n=1 Tax=Necator americanus TaxID=51031 RepID=W2TVU3_NECAM|nr:hypothetical protein NECAME_16889 [Necator americanus]ETN85172.1 hypothetical protein NECAME_16889 [Necator americanus]
MYFKYNLTAVGVRDDFPYVNFRRNCIRMDCPNPGAEVEFLRYCLQTINATAVLIPQYLRSDEMIDMLANGTADITLIPLLQKRERMEKALSILILTSLAVATLLYIYSKLFYNNRMPLLESITVTFSGLLRQCHLNLNGPICVSILACSWLWFTFVITAHYEVLRFFSKHIDIVICFLLDEMSMIKLK